MKSFGALVLLFLVIAFYSCSDDSEDVVSAQVTGIDFRRCACCGGTMITLEEDAAPYAEPFYQWYNTTEEFDIDVNTVFPIAVDIKFRVDPDQCSFSLGIIEVESIVRQ